MKTSIGFNIYSLLGVLEKKHNLMWADGLHRQVLMSVLEAHSSGVSISNQQIVDKGFTSRSSTYRKIAELKQLGFLSEKWNNATCNLELGPAALELIKDAEKDISSIFKANN
jgi:DNA-binding IclR family transcriptional regulator